MIYKGKYISLKEVDVKDAPIYFKLIQKKKLSLYRPGIEKFLLSEGQVAEFLHYRQNILPLVEIETFIYKKNVPFPIGIVGLLGVDNFHKKAELVLTMWDRCLKAFFETVVVSLRAAFLGLKLEKIFFLVSEYNKEFLTFLQKRKIFPEGILKKEAIDPVLNTRYDVFRFALFPDILSDPIFLNLQRHFDVTT